MREDFAHLIINEDETEWEDLEWRLERLNEQFKTKLKELNIKEDELDSHLEMLIHNH